MNRAEKQFVAGVWEYYKENGRHDLEWRNENHLNPYNILVSELMLQQTQVDRVAPKYKAFIKKWPTIAQLASASLGEVLNEWQGLGYNRRAKFLHKIAKEVSLQRDKVFPESYETLLELPGIGPYTAGAIMAFAYNSPVPVIETNIRAVYIHHFFRNANSVDDKEILSLIEKTLDTGNPRAWYWALMDYGSYLKREHKIKNTKSKQYRKQSVFKGSDREIRGAIVRLLTKRNIVTEKEVLTKLGDFNHERIIKQLQSLLREEIVVKQKKLYSLPK